MAKNLVDHSINKEAIKALVAVYGPRETARQAKIPLGTIFSWCTRYGWRKAKFIPRTTGKNGNIPPKDVTQVLMEQLQKHREDSTLHLAKYTARAARKAAEHKDPLSIAKNVSHVAQVHKTVFPPEEGGEMIEGSILVGAALVRENTEEILAATAT